VRVNLAATFGAVAGLWLATVGSARHPAQVVVAIAAGCAFLAVVSLRTRATAADWFTVRLLLAANIAVFGVSEESSLGLPIAILFVLLGVLLLAGSLWSRLRAR
jgi:hypothetical protein